MLLHWIYTFFCKIVTNFFFQSSVFVRFSILIRWKKKSACKESSTDLILQAWRKYTSWMSILSNSFVWLPDSGNLLWKNSLSALFVLKIIYYYESIDFKLILRDLNKVISILNSSWEASTLRKEPSNSLLIAIRNIYIWAHDNLLILNISAYLLQYFAFINPFSISTVNTYCKKLYILL